MIFCRLFDLLIKTWNVRSYVSASFNLSILLAIFFIHSFLLSAWHKWSIFPIQGGSVVQMIPIEHCIIIIILIYKTHSVTDISFQLLLIFTHNSNLAVDLPVLRGSGCLRSRTKCWTRHRVLIISHFLLLHGTAKCIIVSLIFLQALACCFVEWIRSKDMTNSSYAIILHVITRVLAY